MSKNDRVLDFPDDPHGYIAGFNATVRFLKYLIWPALFVALALILILPRSAQ